MVYERQRHIRQPLTQLIAISEQINTSPLRFAQLSSVGNSLKKLLGHSTLVQVINITENKNVQSQILQKKLENFALFYLDSVEEHIMPALVHNEDFQRDQMLQLPTDKSIPNPVYAKLAKVRRLLALYFHASLENKGALDLWFFVQKDFEQGAEKTLRSNPTITAWEKEQTEYHERSQFLQSVRNLKNFSGIVNDYQEADTLTIDIQNICRFFMEKLLFAAELSFLKIKEIRYAYIAKKGKKKAKLKLWINEKNIQFSGETASILKMLLDNPFNEFDIEDFYPLQQKNAKPFIANKATYDSFYRKIEKINLRIALEKDFVDFGIVDFIAFEKYSAHLNQVFARLIQKSH